MEFLYFSLAHYVMIVVGLVYSAVQAYVGCNYLYFFIIGLLAKVTS